AAESRKCGSGSSNTGKSARIAVVSRSVIDSSALDGLAEPLVSLFFEAAGQVHPSRLDDAAVEKHVDAIGSDVIQQALVVGDDQEAALWRGELVDRSEEHTSELQSR